MHDPKNGNCPINSGLNEPCSCDEDKRISENFVREHGGPNPYYKCKTCGYVEVGLREYLAAHLSTHSKPVL